ncbi:tetratricopeptide repeat-containing sensor histidine kinase [Aureivirga marina]|uniref:tetratricopeptide repeat-containing sensor histidine kinase n=1 Tax=Aureivirga marina TaxID=1182451 RepID=UPI0018CAB2D5|nr:tetratricopeptide repeat protein [Aureivirga marina]
MKIKPFKYYRLYFIIFFLVSRVFVNAQTLDISNEESLEKELHLSWKLYQEKKKDSALFFAKKVLLKVNEKTSKEDKFLVNLQLAEIFRSLKKYGEAKEYFIKSEQILPEITSKEFLKKYYLFRGKFAYNQKKYADSESYYLKGIAEFEDKNSIKLSDFYSSLSSVYFKQKKIDKSILNLEKAKEIVVLNNAFEKEIRILNKLGSIYAKTNQFEKAEAIYFKSLETSKKQQNLKGESKAFLNLGNVFYYKGNWAKAIDFYLKSEKIKEKTRDFLGTAKINNNIASIYLQQKRYAESLKYYEKSAGYYLKIKDSIKLSETYINTAIALIHIKRPKKSLDLLEKASLLLYKKKLPKNEMLIELNKAFAFTDLENNKEAIFYLKLAEKKAIQLDDNYSLAVINNLFGANYFQLKQYHKALQFYQKSYDLSLELKLSKEQKNALFGLYETEEKLNNFKKSLIWYEKYGTLKDSLFNVENNQKLLELEEAYEAKQKQQEILSLNQKNKTISLENRLKSDQLKFSILSGFAILLLLISMLFFFIQKQKKQKRILIHTKEKNQLKINQLLQKQEIETLETVLKTQEKERKKIAKDIHDNLGSYLVTLKYQHEATKSSAQNPELEKQYNLISSLIADACSEVRSISHQMAVGEGFSFQFLPALKDLIAKIERIQMFKIMFHCIPEDLKLETMVEVHLYKIIQELFSNILKYANASEVTLQLTKDEENFTLLLEDNGVGFHKNQERKGIGLKNIKERVSMLHGTLEINSAIGIGTTILIIIPLNI